MFLSKNIFYILLLVIFPLFLLSSCKKNDPKVTNEQELITSLTYTLTANGQPTVTLSFKDLDGQGGNRPIITGGKLVANTVYVGKIEVLNEIAGNNITEEIKKESATHQFFFSATDVNITTFYADLDNTPEKNPIGIETTITTGQTSTGKLKITLRHQPSKSAEGVKAGNITNAGGETDIEVEFPVSIQ